MCHNNLKCVQKQSPKDLTKWWQLYYIQTLSKSIRQYSWGMGITVKIEIFRVSNIRTTFFNWQHSIALPVHNFIMAVPTR